MPAKPNRQEEILFKPAGPRYGRNAYHTTSLRTKQVYTVVRQPDTLQGGIAIGWSLCNCRGFTQYGHCKHADALTMKVAYQPLTQEDLDAFFGKDPFEGLV